MALELDGGPDAAALRRRYEQLTSLHDGLFWPRKVASDLRWHDQGLREIVALATAAQVFRVCSGAVKYQQGEERGASEERQLASATEVPADSKGAVGAADTKGAVGAGVGGIGGALAGWAAYADGQSVLLSLLVGLAAAVLAAFAVTFSFKRSARSEATIKHIFVRDTSVASLDRDLPLVIERIRDAGLAPVFVIDELDKVHEAGQAIGALISRTKHIVADNSFFCFLADRAYFDHLEERLVRRAYPVEYTYFSHRLLIHADSEPLRDLLLELITLQSGTSPSAGADDVIAQYAIGAYVAHRAQHHIFDVQRELASLVDEDGWIKNQNSSFEMNILVHVFIEYAIMHYLGRSDLGGTTRNSSGLGQRLIDASYFVSRHWMRGDEKVTITPDALKVYMRDRSRERDDMSASVLPGHAQITEATEITNILFPVVNAVRDCLLNPRQLAADLFNNSPEEAKDRSLRHLLAASMIFPLLEHIEGEPGNYRFLVDARGNWVHGVGKAVAAEDQAVKAAVDAVLETYGVKLTTLILILQPGFNGGPALPVAAAGTLLVAASPA